MITCWVYKLCSGVSGLYLQIAFMAWIWVVFAHWSFSLLMHIQIGGLDLGCLCHKSHDLLILSLCRRDEMLLPGTVMVEDCGWLFYADRLDILRIRCFVHGCDHGTIDFGMTWFDVQVHPWCSLAWISDLVMVVYLLGWGSWFFGFFWGAHDVHFEFFDCLMPWLILMVRGWVFHHDVIDS